MPDCSVIDDSGGDVTMTMQSEQLIGARVTGGDGQVVGTVQQIFNDDKDGTPVWARIKAGTRERFVPLAGSKVTKNGLSVPYDAKQILSSPDIGADRHMSSAQTEQLRSYFGLAVPAQGGPPDEDTQRGQAPQDEAQRDRGKGQGGQVRQDEGQTGQTQAGRGTQDQAQAGGTQGGQALRDQPQAGGTRGDQAPQGQTQAGRGTQDQAQAGGTQSALQDETDRGGGRAHPDEAMPDQAMPDQAMPDQARPDQARSDQAMRDQAMRDEAMREDAARGGQRGETRRDEAEGGDVKSADEWLIRAEERVSVGTEAVETGRARLHKYVDVEPVEQAVHVFHEEYEIERVPIGADERIPGVIGESVQEIVLHEERAVFRKEAVPVERIRLVVKRVSEDRTLRDEIRKERVEVEAEDGREGEPAEASRQEGRHRR
jgi:stress response protein YsnF